MSSDPNYRLVFLAAVEDPGPVRQLICNVTGLHPADANQWIARAPGIVRHPLAEPEVRKLLDGLFDLGVAAEAWKVDALPNLAPPRIVHDMTWSPTGFQVKGLRGEPTHHVPWDKVELIAAGRIEQDDDLRAIYPPNWVQSVSLGLNALLRRPQAVARRQRVMKVLRDPVGEVLVVRKEPRIALRIVENQMKYTALGDRIQPSASANFPLLLQALVAQADQATIAPTTRALLEPDRDADAALFPTSQALLDYTTLELLRAGYRRDRDQAGG